VAVEPGSWSMVAGGWKPGLSTSPYPSHSGDAGKTLVSDLNGAQLCGISWGAEKLGSLEIWAYWGNRGAEIPRRLDTPLKEVLRPLLQEVGFGGAQRVQGGPVATFDVIIELCPRGQVPGIFRLIF